jgi:hypothetical protein
VDFPINWREMGESVFSRRGFFAPNKRGKAGNIGSASGILDQGLFWASPEDYSTISTTEK